MQISFITFLTIYLAVFCSADASLYDACLLPSNNYHYFVIPALGSSLKLIFLFVVDSIPVWSRHHPQIPQRHVPQWTQDMKNRSLILEVGIFGSPDFDCRIAGLLNVLLEKLLPQSRSCRKGTQSNLFNTDTKGIEPSVRFTELSIL